jgi:hypothetical protein
MMSDSDLLRIPHWTIIRIKTNNYRFKTNKRNNYKFKRTGVWNPDLRSVLRKSWWRLREKRIDYLMGSLKKIFFFQIAECDPVTLYSSGILCLYLLRKKLNCLTDKNLQRTHDNWAKFVYFFNELYNWHFVYLFVCFWQFFNYPIFV